MTVAFLLLVFVIGVVLGMGIAARSHRVRYYGWMLFFHPWMFIPNVEWGERWGGWPHCMNQGQCWMHISPARRWCRCKCRWCRLAGLMWHGGSPPTTPLSMRKEK